LPRKRVDQVLNAKGLLPSIKLNRNTDEKNRLMHMRNDATVGQDEGMKGRGEGPVYICGTYNVPVTKKNLMQDRIIIFAKKKGSQTLTFPTSQIHNLTTIM
jgi:hypothetical protein